jgi:hypothetical protein
MTQYTPRPTTGTTVNPPTVKSVSLAPFPLEIPPATSDETAPRSLIIKGEMTQERKDFLRRYAWYSKAQIAQKTGVAKPDDVLDVVQWVTK